MNHKETVGNLRSRIPFFGRIYRKNLKLRTAKSRAISARKKVAKLKAEALRRAERAILRSRKAEEKLEEVIFHIELTREDLVKAKREARLSQEERRRLEIDLSVMRSSMDALSAKRDKALAEAEQLAIELREAKEELSRLDGERTGHLTQLGELRANLAAEADLAEQLAIELREAKEELSRLDGERTGHLTQLGELRANLAAEADLRNATDRKNALLEKNIARLVRLNGAVKARSEVKDKNRQIALNRIKEYQAKLNTAPELSEPFREFLRHIKPKFVDGFSKNRFGGQADGGYVMIDDFDDVTHAISVGIGDEISWDESMAKLGLKLVQVDHTVPAPLLPSAEVNFFRQRLVADAPADGETTIETLLSELGQHDSLVLKIDIEGDEWGILAHLPRSLFTEFKQIVIEFHDLHKFSDPNWREIAVAAIENLSESHQCVHVHGNNFRPLVVIGGVSFPQVFEATFVIRESYKFKKSSEIFPILLDRPNNASKSDYYLGNLTF
ncbi:hypothetical protein [Hyphomonas sp.]|uniref:hypothetical protein n=1 Tax=Alphaproteobacteria TaxID=28211 RepID=UPI003265CFC9